MAAGTGAAGTGAAGTGVAATGVRVVGGFALVLDRLFHADSHMWVALTGPVAAAGPGDRARIGLDALGVETSGTLAQLSLPVAGAAVTGGRSFGQLEAAKFVGPLVSPVSGTVLAVNEAAAADPGLTERDPYGAGWLIEIALSDPAAELHGLLADPAEITRWFAAKVEDYRSRGVIAQ